ncbi:MAG TPA: GNAT family N-acetyltransferase, partial [Actinomycetota bacterium]|nr:GNAT family N-acetyltransferase [Actinomycetota bacterium]
LSGSPRVIPSRLIRETVALRDGRKVVLRPIRADDAPRLIAFHEHLSPESRYFRFFGPKPVLLPEEAEYLAKVDHLNRFAIVAVGTGDHDGELTAVGRFDLVAPDVAEPAIVVRDDYQGVGLGSAILERMAEIGRGRGVRRFSGEILVENKRMLELLRSTQLEVEVDDGVVRVSGPVGDWGPVFKALEIVARQATSVAVRGTSLKRGRRP